MEVARASCLPIVTGRHGDIPKLLLNPAPEPLFPDETLLTAEEALDSATAPTPAEDHDDSVRRYLTGMKG